MQVFVKSLDGKSMAVPVDSGCSSAGDIITIAAEKASLGPGILSQLRLYNQGHLLYPETPVEQCNLSHGATLHMTSILQGGKRVKVRLLTPDAPGVTCGPTVSIDLEPDTPMYEVKLQLQEATGIPVEAQKVMLAGIGDMVLGDKRTNVGYTYCGSTSNFGLATMGQPA